MGDKNTSGSANDTIGDVANEWRKKSRKQFKLNRIKRMVFDAQNGKKPSEYQPEDYIPRIPEALKAKYSQDVSSNQVDSPAKTIKRKSTNQENETPTKIVSKKSKSDRENKSINKSKSDNSSRQILGDSSNRSGSPVIKRRSRNETNTMEKSSRFRSVSPADTSDNQSYLAPLKSIRSSSTNRDETYGMRNSVLSSASKKRGSHRSLEQMNRLINDSRSHKKPSEYEPEDYIPRSAQIAMAEASLKAAKEKQLREEEALQKAKEEQAIKEAELKATLEEQARQEDELRREIAALKEAEEAEAEQNDTKSTSRRSRKSLYNANKSTNKSVNKSTNKSINKSTNKTVNKSARKSVRIQDLSANSSNNNNSNMSNMSTTRSMSRNKSSNRIADTSQESISEDEEPVINKSKRSKSFNKTREVIMDTQPEPVRSQDEEDGSPMVKNKSMKSRAFNMTKSVIKETQEPIESQESQEDGSPVVKNKSMKSRTFNKTKSIIKETQEPVESQEEDSPVVKNKSMKSRTFNKTKSIVKEPIESQESQEDGSPIINTKALKSRTFNKTKSIIKETQQPLESQEIGTKSFRQRNRIVDSSQDSLPDDEVELTKNQTSKSIKLNNLPAFDSEDPDELTDRVNMMDKMLPKQNLLKGPMGKRLSTAAAITPILTRRQSLKGTNHKNMRPGNNEEYSYIDESILNEGGYSSRKSKQDKYKMSSTANTSNQLQFTFNNEDRDIQSTRLNDIDEYAEDQSKLVKNKSARQSLKASATRTINDKTEFHAPEAIEQIISVSPAKKAFETSLRRKSNTILLAHNVDHMAPLELDNDEIIKGSGQLEDENGIEEFKKPNQLSVPQKLARQSTANSDNDLTNKSKTVAKSRIEITKIPQLYPTKVPDQRPPPIAPSTIESLSSGKDLDIDLDMKQKKKSSKKHRNLKDQTILDDDDDMELATAQSGMFIRRSFSKSINSTTRSINTTTNNRTALSSTRNIPNNIRKSVLSNPFKTPLVPELPENTISPAKLPRSVSPRKSPRLQPETTNKSKNYETPVHEMLDYEETVASMFSSQDNIELPPETEEPEPVDKSLARAKATKANKELLLSGKSKKSTKMTDDEATISRKKSGSAKKQKNSTQNSTQESDTSTQKSRKKKSNKRKSVNSDQETDTESNSPVSKQKPSTPPGKENQRSKSTKLSTKKKIADSSSPVVRKKSSKKGLATRDDNQPGTSDHFENIRTQKRMKNTQDMRRRTIYDLEQPDEVNDIEENGLRRSKRVKIDKLSAPVYEFEEMSDFNGQVLMVQHIVGVTKKNFENKYCQLMTDVMLQKKREKENIKKKSKKGHNKKALKEVYHDQEDQLDNNFQDTTPNHEQVDHNTSNHEPIHVHLQSQEQTINNITNWDEGRVNLSQETLLFENDDDQSANNLQKKVFCFANKLKEKNFDKCYPGVSLNVISPTDGLLCIEPGGTTKTQTHSCQVNYFMQSGSQVVLSLNGSISKHGVCDVIKIPNDLQYKFRNASPTQKAYLHFQFI